MSLGCAVVVAGAMAADDGWLLLLMKEASAGVGRVAMAAVQRCGGAGLCKCRRQCCAVLYSSDAVPAGNTKPNRRTNPPRNAQPKHPNAPRNRQRERTTKTAQASGGVLS